MQTLFSSSVSLRQLPSSTAQTQISCFTRFTLDTAHQLAGFPVRLQCPYLYSTFKLPSAVHSRCCPTVADQQWREPVKLVIID
jgi:hypothetical protein